MLSGWKAKTLSLAGQVTLAQSVLAAIPAYVMQTAVLLIMTCEAIDRKIRNFVWGSSDEAQKVHLVSWDKICTAKEDGGLGLKSAHELNISFLTKLAFTFVKDSERLWVRVLKRKYFHETEEGFVHRKLKLQSSIGKGISKEWSTMTLGARIVIRDGHSTNFWTARWVDSGDHLIELIEEEGVDLDLGAVVADFVEAEGGWDVRKLNSCLPLKVVDLVMGMTPPHDSLGEDL
ncbi:Putative ribonuclease H protein At1g65750 [Linum perenne]